MYWPINLFWQSFFLNKPTLTEKNVGDLSGKVCIVTGGNSGVGFQLCTILYGANAKLYLAGRDAQKCAEAVQQIKAKHPNSKGSITVLQLDLADLSTIKGSAETFLKSESQLHFLSNNAGVMFPAEGSKTVQGHELQVGTNCVGHWLFANLVKGALIEAAKTSPPNSVRVAWAASIAVDLLAPKEGLDLTGPSGGPKTMGVHPDYGQSKAGNVFMAKAFGDSLAKNGIVSVAFNPGNLRSNLQRTIPSVQRAILNMSLYNAIYGAYTELWCGFSPDLTTADNGIYVAPWGKKNFNRGPVEAAKRANGGTYDKFIAWLDQETKAYY